MAEKKLAQQFDVPFLGDIPLVKSISEAGDSGEPVILQKDNPMSAAFMDLAKRVAQQVAIQNSIPKTAPAIG